MGKLSRTKGAATEREVVNLHRVMGIKAERVPLSGATRYQSNGEDVDVYALGDELAPLLCQVKRLKGPRGTRGVLKALGEADALFLRFDAEPGQAATAPTVVLPWRTWERIVREARRRAKLPG
jgi:hypothetical protein